MYRFAGLALFNKLIAKILGMFVPEQRIGRLNINTDISTHRVRELYLEFLAHKIFWKLLIKIKRPRRVIFVSGAFYAPLVSAAKKRAL